MRIERRLAAVAAVVLLAAAGCTGTADPAPAPSPTTTLGASSPSPSPSPTSDSERAAVNAEALVREYYRVTDAVAKAPADTASLDTVAAEPELSRSQEEFQQWAADDWHQTGDLRVAELVVQAVSLGTADEPSTTAQVDVCYDSAGLDIVDSAGTSQVASNRPDRRWERLTLVNADYRTDPEHGWRVSDRQTLEQEPCAG